MPLDNYFLGSKKLIIFYINRCDIKFGPMNDNTCISEPVFNIVLGSLLCVGGMISYIPQYYSLIKAKQPKGISEMSLVTLCIGSAFLTANAFILNWWKFNCYDNCSFWLCTSKLLSLFQICVGWIMVIYSMDTTNNKVNQNQKTGKFKPVNVHITNSW